MLPCNFYLNLSFLVFWCAKPLSVPVVSKKLFKTHHMRESDCWYFKVFNFSLLLPSLAYHIFHLLHTFTYLYLYIRVCYIIMYSNYGLRNFYCNFNSSLNIEIYLCVCPCEISVCHHTQVLQLPFGVLGILARHGSVRRARDEQHDHCRLTKTVVII